MSDTLGKAFLSALIGTDDQHLVADFEILVGSGGASAINQVGNSLQKVIEASQTRAQATHRNVIKAEIDSLAPLTQIGDKLDESRKRCDRADDGCQYEDFFGEKKRRVIVCDRGKHKSRITLVQMA